MLLQCHTCIATVSHRICLAGILQCNSIPAFELQSCRGGETSARKLGSCVQTLDEHLETVSVELL